MTGRTTVRLPDELLARARRKALAEGRTLTSLIADGLRLVTASTGRPKASMRAPLPVSKARGGPMPGIDISKSAPLQEMDDLDYAERMKRFT
jgi:hypothetical protein